MSTIVGVTEPFQVIIPLLYAVIAGFSHLHLIHHIYWRAPALPTHSTSSTPLSFSCRPIFRSSFPLQVLTTALQTVLTSAQRMTARWSSWKRAPKVPAHAGANIAAITAAAGRAAPNRPKWKRPAWLTVLHPALLKRLRGSPRVAQQRAAAVRRLILRSRKKTAGNQGCDTDQSPAVVTGHIKPTVVSLVKYIHYNVCFLWGKDTGYNAILFRNSHLVCPGGLLCLQLFYWSVHIICIYFLSVNLTLCAMLLLSLSVLRCEQYRELTPWFRRYPRIHGHAEFKSSYLLFQRRPAHFLTIMF